jgi:hypothetical protein
VASEWRCEETMLRMLRREREEGLGYGSCVETGGVHGAVLYVVWHVRELEYYCEELFRFSGWRGRTRRYTCSPRGQHRGFSTSPGPTAHRTAAEITDMRPPHPPRGRAGGGGSLPPSVTNYDQWGRRALSVSVICKASMMCVISQASIRQCTGN